jgi:CHASE2 domain-containing sensor protein
MNQKVFSLVAGLIFLVVALAHALRLVFGWHVMLQGWSVPVWVSWIAFLISGFLGYEGLRLSRRP